MSDPANENQEKKILIDEDWKSRVQAEKEELQGRKEEELQRRKEEEQPEKPAEAAAAEKSLPLPPATFDVLVTSLATQAMMALGLMPHPLSGKTEVQLDQAKHFIDTLGMLQEKTEGNRTPEESTLVEDLLHELRWGYVSARQRVEPQPDSSGTADPPS